MTFCVAQRNPDTGDLGIAVASKYLAVGSIVPYARAEVGVVATQFFANPLFGPRGLDLLERGVAAAEVLNTLLADDEHRVRRQLVVMDAAGEVACVTGIACLSWAGHMHGSGYACSGNTLAGEEVVSACRDVLLRQEGELWDRLVQALAAGQAAGGDRSGQQSASLLVVRASGGYGGYTDRLIDLRVDDHSAPIAELERILGIWKLEREHAP
ncbi:MAG TPA: DUF1028 domain-containing protein [Longimicrobium sp.]